MNKSQRKIIILQITISVILGFFLVGIAILITPENCELIGDDTAGMHTICLNCEDFPQPCLNEMGNLGARIIGGLGILALCFPVWYPFIKDFQGKPIIEEKLFD